MSKFRQIKNSFTGGEIGEKLLGRIDIQQYQNACAEVTNFVPMSQGGITKRMGSEYLQTVGARPAIIPFVFSKDEGFAILMNHEDEKANEGTGAGLRGIAVFSTDGTPQELKISSKTINGLGLTTLWKVEPDGWHHTQVGDIVFIVHNSGSIPPIVIKRIDSNISNLNHEFEAEWYLKPEDSDKTKGINSANTMLRWNFREQNLNDEIQIKYTAGFLQAFESNGTTKIPKFFTKNDKDTYFRWGESAASENIYILGDLAAAPDNDGSKIIIADEVYGTATVDKKSEFWRRSYWSNNNWPRTITEFQQRLVFGGTKEDPDLMWSSKNGNLFHMLVDRMPQDTAQNTSGVGMIGDPLPEDPFVNNSSSQEVNRIQWMSGHNGLLVGNLGCEETIIPSADSGYTGLGADIRRITGIGSTNVMPGSMGNSVYFISRSKRKLHKLNFDSGQYIGTAQDMSLLNDNISSHNSNFSEYITKIIAQPSQKIIWCLTSANQLIALSDDEATGVQGWHKHTIEGPGGPVTITGLGMVPSDDGRHDDLWLTLRNTDGILVSYADCVDATDGSDTVERKTGFNFIDFAAARATGTTGNPGLLRRVIIKIPENITKADLEGAWFLLKDKDKEYGFWFNFNGASLVPSEVESGVGLDDNDQPFIDSDFKIEIDLDPVADNFEAIRQAVFDSFADANDLESAFLEQDFYYTLERIAEEWRHPETFNDSEFKQDKPLFMDSCKLVRKTSPTNTFDGFDHLDNLTVSVLGDGYYLGEKTVSSSGEIVLDNDYTEVIAGFKFPSRIRTLPVEDGGDFGVPIGATQRIDRVTLLLYRTFGLEVGYELGALEELELLPSDMTVLPLQNLPLFTGRYIMDFPATYNDEQFVIIEQNKPYPCTVLAIVTRGKTYDASQ